jgi:hypothetical protein
MPGCAPGKQRLPTKKAGNYKPNRLSASAQHALTAINLNSEHQKSEEAKNHPEGSTWDRQVK